MEGNKGSLHSDRAPRQPLIDKLHERAQEKNWPDKQVASRRTILKAAPFIAAGLAAFPGVKAMRGEKRETTQNIIKPEHSNKEDESFRIVLSPEQMELGQKHGNFDNLRAYPDAPFLSYDETTNSGRVIDNPEVMVVEMTSYDNNIVFRKGPTISDEGAIILTKGNPDYEKVYKSRIAAVRILGHEYGDTTSPGRLQLPPGEQGGAWFALVGAEKGAEGNVNYYYSDLEGNKFPPGEAPLCFSATFGNRVNPT